jgi:hypothetical protein
MKLQLNITPKLTLIFVLFAVLVLVVISTPAYTSGRASLEAAAVSELLSTAIEKQAALNTWIMDTQTHATSLSASPSLQERTADLLAARASGDQAKIQAANLRLVAELQIWEGKDREFLGWLLLDPDSGQVIAATDASDEGKYRDDQAYFINGKSASYVQNVYYSLGAQATMLTVSAPIHSPAGELLGVLAGNLDLGAMNAIISRRSGLRPPSCL